MIRPRTLALIPFVLAAVAGPAILLRTARAQDPGPYPVTIRAELAPARAKPGEKVTARLVVEVAPGWHIYGTKAVSRYMYPSRPKLVLPAGWSADGALRAPKPKIHEDATLGNAKIPWYTGETTLEQDFTVPEDAPAGEVAVEWKLDHMTCDSEKCLDPRVLTADAKLEVTGRAGGPAPAKPGDGTESAPVPGAVVSVTAGIAPDSAAPGALVTVHARVRIAKGWHIYGPDDPTERATSVELSVPDGFRAEGAMRGPPGTAETDLVAPGGTSWYTGEVGLDRDLRIPAGAKPGPVPVTVEVHYYACNESGMCLDPSVATASATLTVLAGPAVAPAPGTGATAGVGTAAAPEPGESGGSSGLGLFLWVAFTGGLGSILLPCVYPLIPLTVAFFSKQDGKSRNATVLRAVLFCFGILLTFTVLGIALGPVLQLLAVNVWLNVFLFLLMLVLALSLLGMFDIQLPSSWTGRLQAAGSGGSALAPVFMGVAFSFASFSCTVGVIGPILAHGSSDFGHAAGGMLAYSLGFALPFFLLALFPATVSSMPRSGSWMNTMKVMLGFVELCFAGYYLWRMDLGLGWGIGTWDIVLALWTVTAFVAGLYLLGKVRLPKDDPVEIVTVPRAVGAIVVLLFALYLLGGFLGRVRFPGWLNGLLPPKTAVLTANGGDSDQVPVAPKPGFADAEFHPSPYNGLWWTTDYDHALEIAKKTGRRVLLNFTGIYCTNCRQVETGPFLANGEVRAELEKMVLVELWTDITSRAAEKGNWDLHHTTMEKSARYRDFRTEEFGTTANPYYVVLGPDGKRLAEMGYPTEGDSQLLAFLRTGE